MQCSKSSTHSHRASRNSIALSTPRCRKTRTSSSVVSNSVSTLEKTIPLQSIFVYIMITRVSNMISWRLTNRSARCPWRESISSIVTHRRK
ncbi:hypothetical protein NY2A_b098R [Paramecium bursaria Chlorella virus NY2A]|uniref:Uncharacterized protein b098R n=1 Tax=Paramecium bursaria Chlorella virus NY2A TaxID=46021 RepID=A7IVX3_PBCVN|nr:hypothetical protein NY2A_b098R [Paramecium bursaria Chlorella virus NY2A]YP_001498167.1 hypothetical protein AR158_c085R [Paramecium bursaria Chlorella virus AR158]ABT14497.1 hypothetical protein NY2A_b098R [Paramecium bursaria Chlorella virus NY2A]ABU43631.1 hypothetical protein AR158_c085R [Paramecium bursaria Chlorella virus AR158]